MDHCTALAEAVRLYKAGEDDAAHEIVQGIDSPVASYLHGILHRAEGDYSNARYWFIRSNGLPKQLGIDADALTHEFKSQAGIPTPDLQSRLDEELDAVLKFSQEV
jgi:hypothetical protein